MSQTSFVRSSQDVFDLALAVIAQIMFRELMELVRYTLDKNFLLESTRTFNLFEWVSNLFILMATLFFRLTSMSSDISISQIAAIESVHLPIAVKRLWCLCLQGSRANENFIGHSVQ